jgi:hypothetical protein
MLNMIFQVLLLLKVIQFVFCMTRINFYVSEHKYWMWLKNTTRLRYWSQALWEAVVCNVGVDFLFAFYFKTWIDMFAYSWNFEAHRQQCSRSAVTTKNCILSACYGCVFDTISRNKQRLFPPSTINRLNFISGTDCVLSAVETEATCTIYEDATLLMAKYFATTFSTQGNSYNPLTVVLILPTSGMSCRIFW